MSNNITEPFNPYEWLTNIDSLNFQDKSILIIGSGEMARQYAQALSSMKFNDVTVISRNNDRLSEICNEFGFNQGPNNLEDGLTKIKKKDLIIIATSVDSLLPIAKLVLKNGQNNILIEKPGSLYYQELLELNEKLNSQKVRIGYNRLAYPNLHKLKQLVQDEGGITSCNFFFTELVHTIDFDKETEDIYTRWGISNSLHVISMAFHLIGLPKEYHFYQSGKLDWHPNGSIFVGSGLTDKNIPFSYHADWGSSGRWGIEVMTKENAYRLISLEELFVCHKGSFEWQPVPFKTAYPNVKQGVAEEVTLMLSKEAENKIPLVTLEKAALFNKIVEKIFGYDSNKQ